MSVELKGITKYYGNTLAAKDVNLHVDEGEFLTLLGSSGCGKTTLLNVIAGFIKPTEGSVYISEQDVTDLPPYKRNCGMVFQNYALFPHMIIYDNIAFGLKIRKMRQADIKARVKEILELIRLPGYEKRYPKQLSGGEQQRVAVGRALAINPLVLLMDEPLSNLDAKLRAEMRKELRALQQKLKITTIYVTHDQIEALTMADRLALIGPRHRIEQIGSPTELYMNPKTKFAADFIGMSNFFEGRVLSVYPDRDEISILSKELTFYVSWSEELKEGDKIVVAVRPERIKLTTDPSGAKNLFPSKIVYVEYLGGVVQYVLDVGGHQVTVVEQNVSGIPNHRRGDRLYVSWSPSNVMILR